MDTHESNLSQLHYQIVRGLIEEGACPSNSDLAKRLGASPAALENLLRDLAAIHGVVLHPHICEPWVVHPFSLTPTLNWIQGSRHGWWAPCIWCAFGVATLVGGEVRLHTRYGAESDPLVIRVIDGRPTGSPDVVVHFAIPPAKAWDNVHQHCALVLPFRSEDEIAAWSTGHALPRGEAVPLEQVADLARAWYGSHADPGWHKWSVEEAGQIFHRAGLQSVFWDVGTARGRF
jgi:hypothetical protein